MPESLKAGDATANPTAITAGPTHKLGCEPKRNPENFKNLPICLAASRNPLQTRDLRRRLFRLPSILPTWGRTCPIFGPIGRWDGAKRDTPGGCGLPLQNRAMAKKMPLDKAFRRV